MVEMVEGVFVVVVFFIGFLCYWVFLGLGLVIVRFDCMELRLVRVCCSLVFFRFVSWYFLCCWLFCCCFGVLIFDLSRFLFESCCRVL